MSKKKYLVTGATGFIGASLVLKMISDGHFVRGLDNDWRGDVGKLKDLPSDQFEFFKADIRDRNAVFEACQGMDAVIHLAFVNGTEHFYKQPEFVLDVGVKGMTHILDACIEVGIKDFVLASSSEVYQTPPSVPTDETAPLSIPDVLNPRYSYAGGKIICELMAVNYGRKYFDRMTIFRPHNVYGPHMGHEHVIPQFVAKAVSLLKGKPGGDVDFPIQGDGLQQRAFIFIDDFTEGLMKIINSGKHLEIYHIGTQDEITIKALAENIVGILGGTAKVLAGEAAVGGTLRRCPDTTKLKGLGFQSRVSLSEGLKQTVHSYAEEYSAR